MPAVVTESTVEDGLRVLVVSDDPQVREAARYGFPAGVQVDFADDAREAARVLGDRPPSVVVADLQTGRAGGYALARDMSESGGFGGVPVLILLQRSQDAWLAQMAGASLHRTKPLRPGTLVRDVLALARRS